MSSLVPKTPTEFFPYAVHVIFGILVAHSFASTDEIFFPLDDFTAFSLYQLGAASLPYAIIITSWIGYSLSISEYKYKPNKYGFRRFLVDLIILFLYYILSNFVGDNLKNYGFVFALLLPVIFLSYLIWDGVKFQEYQNVSKKSKEYIQRRAIITATYAGLFIIQAVSYIYFEHLVLHLQPETTQFYLNLIGFQIEESWTSLTILNIIFICTSWLLLFGYRKAKYGGQKQRKTAKLA